MNRTTGIITTVKAGATLTARRFVATDGTHKADEALGAIEYNYDAGSAVGVQISGIVEVEAAGAVTAQSFVTSDANGKAVALTLSTATYSIVGNVQKICGKALTTATADGEIIMVKL